MRSCFRSIGRDGHGSGNGLRGVRNIFIYALTTSVFFLLLSFEIRASEPVEIMAGRVTLKFKENVPDSVKVSFAKDYDLMLIAHSQNTGVCLYQAKEDNVLPLIEKIKINPVIEFVEADYVQKKDQSRMILFIPINGIYLRLICQIHGGTLPELPL